MFLALAALLSASQVVEARITVDLRVDGATVNAAYAFSAAPSDLAFDAMRWPSQSVALLRPTDFVIRDLGGLIRIEPLAKDESRYGFAYDVSGNPTRIPLFVPNAPTAPGVSNVSIVVRGATSSILLSDAFPRFAREVDGSLVGHPANLPSFLLLPGGNRWSRARVADGMVLSLLIAASGFWILRRIRRSR